jgi:hypothetical protein
VVVHHRQPAAIYLHRLGPAPETRSTDEVLERGDDVAVLPKHLRPAEVPNPFRVPGGDW